MEDILYEIIGGALILGVVIIVIMVFRSSSDVVKNAAENQSNLDSVAIEDTIGYSGSVYGGEKLKDAMSYTDVTPGIQIYWGDGTGLENCYNDLTDVNKENIKKEMLQKTNEKYTLTIQYFSTPNPTVGATPDRIKGDLEISCIRFIYKKN